MEKNISTKWIKERLDSSIDAYIKTIADICDNNHYLAHYNHLKTLEAIERYVFELMCVVKHTDYEDFPHSDDKAYDVAEKLKKKLSDIWVMLDCATKEIDSRRRERNRKSK